MKYILLILTFIFLQNCSKPKTVLICGNHACINKAEAEQYFEENLSIEVKIIDIKKKEIVDLVQLNLKNSSIENRQINIVRKIETKEKVKVLTNNEIEKIKKKVLDKKQNKKKIKKIVLKDINENDKILKKDKITSKKKAIEKIKINVNREKNEVVDICIIIEKCNIDEISKYLLKKDKKKKFPDITTKE